MSSSTNPFALLSNTPSSSKEQETQVPVTGTQDTDQKMQDAGPPAEAQDLSLASSQATLPRQLTKAEKLKEFERIAASEKRAMEQEEEEERKKKLRQGNSSMLVGKPINSTAPSQGPRKRTAPFDGAKDSLKRRRMEPLPRSRSGEQPVAAPSTVPDSEAEGPEVATKGKPSAPALLVPEAPILATIHRVADYPRDRRIDHARILAACKTEEEKARLICISLDAWPKILGHFSGYAQRRNPDRRVKELHTAVFNGRRPYHMFIWFVAPNDFETFEKQCLSFFTRYFEQRRLPHADFQAR